MNLSRGVNGAILCAGGPPVQDELRALLELQGVSAVPASTVVQTVAGRLPFRFILHAVANDAFYDSSIELAGKTVVAALGFAINQQAETISMPALATGFGRLSIGR